MKDQSQKRKKPRLSVVLVQIIIGASIGGILGFLGGYYGIGSFFEGEFTFKGILLFLLFVIVAGFIHINIHEFGHFIFGRMFGYKLISYRIGVFTWNNENGRMKFSIIKNKGYSGLCAMIPPEQVLPAYKEILFYSGGVLLNILSGLVFIALSYMLTGPTELMRLFLIALGSIGIVLGLINFAPFISLNNPSDGKIIWSRLLKNPFAEKLVEINKIAAQLSAGIRPGNMEIPALGEEDAPQVYDLTAMLFSYYKALDNDKVEDMHHYIGLLEKHIGLFPHPALPALYYELCFIACISGDESKARIYYEKGGKILQRDQDVNGLRVKAYYEYYINKDETAAAILCESALAVADKFPIKGQGLMERDLVADLLEKIKCGVE